MVARNACSTLCGWKLVIIALAILGSANHSAAQPEEDIEFGFPSVGVGLDEEGNLKVTLKPDVKRRPRASQVPVWLDMLNSREVVERIELSDSQHEELIEMQKELEKALKVVVTKYNGMPQVERNAVEFSSDVSAPYTTAERRFHEILLPHQIDALKTVQLRHRFIAQGALRFLLSPDISRELELTEDDKRRLAREWEQIVKECQEEIARVVQNVDIELRSSELDLLLRSMAFGSLDR